MEGLVLALGYDQARLNIHKSGREIDIEARHRTESRTLIAECKATEDPIGGDEANKFVGILDAERRKRPGVSTVGYFISLSGLTQTAIEQEQELRNNRFIYLNGQGVVEELVRGRIVVPEFRALELAGRCAAASSLELVPEASCELVAHEIGWIWVVYFAQHKETSKFALVHADGNYIAPILARSVITADTSIGGRLESLGYLEPPRESGSADEKINEARKAYFTYLSQECGEIQLAGLPADRDIGSRGLRLESIFVPLHVAKSHLFSESEANQVLDSDETTRHDPRTRLSHKKERSAEQRLSFGKVFADRSRIAILGLPGGGKSTLLKRLATAYAFPSRRDSIKDQLPARTWLPLFVRCRQLDSQVRSPIIDIINSISLRAEMSEDLAEGFRLLVSRGLRDGAILLLVDGLDEITNDRDRVSFVHQLRTFLAVYP
jgi:hypothetical protein